MERLQRVTSEPRRGDIYIADLDGGFGVRPAVIIQNNKGNHFSDTVIVVPITSRRKKWMPTHVRISSASGLRTPGTALCEHILTIPQYDLRKYIGSIEGTPEEQEVDRAIRASLALNR